MSQAKIAIITGQLVVGGAETQLYLWLSHLDRGRFQPVLLTLHPNQADYWENPIKLLDIPLLPVPNRGSRLARLLHIVKILRPFEPKLIHSWNLFSSPYAGAAAKLLSAKSLGGLRGSFRAFCNNRLESRLTLCLVDAILANSYSAAMELRSMRKPRKMTIYAVQNAVEDSVYDRSIIRKQLSQTYDISPNGLLIGSVGHLDPNKRFDIIFKAIAHLREDTNDFHFILIGDGPEKSNLERLAVELGITRYVTFLGEVPGASGWLSALDIFCFASSDEGLPNVVMEAAMAGVPILSWRVPFIEEILEDGKMALLVDFEDLIGYKNALLNLVNSNELRIRLGNAGRGHMLEKFSINRFAQGMTMVYKDLLGIQ